MQTSQVFSQRTWPQSGDLDDCWVVATIWCQNAVAPWLYLQNTTGFRNAAGDPDDGQTDGGRLSEIMQACRTLWPQLHVQPHRGTWAALEKLIDAGHPVSVAVDSGALPPRHQYGFTGLHQIALYSKGSGPLGIMNPLDKDRARPDTISRDNARAAAKAYGAGTAYDTYAAVFPTEAEAFTTHPLYVPPPPPLDCQAELDRLNAELAAEKARADAAESRVTNAKTALGCA